MRKIMNSLVGLFVLSLFFVGTSFSDEMGSMAEPVYWDSFEATNLIGIPLKTSAGDEIGSIDDLLVNQSTGQIESLWVTDVPGLGAHGVAIPFHDIEKWGPHTFVYNPPEDRYRFDNELAYRSYDLFRSSSIHEGGSRFSTFLVPESRAKTGRMSPRINDFVINRDGHVVFVVLEDVGGTEGKMVATPFGALSMKDNNVFALDTTRDRLSAAPAFSWSDVSNQRYAADIYRYYGLQPYWETM
jgi:sporulation protein YlmC with PRC-barrel domain